MVLKKQYLLYFVLLCVVVIGLAAVWRYLDRSSMTDCALEWGRLAELPVEIRCFDVEKTGNIFTRGFLVSFSADRDVVSRWLGESEGIGDSERLELSGGGVRYLIKPGGGAQRAEVEIDKTGSAVKIYVCWS